MFPGNDEIYQQILQKLEQNENISVQKTLSLDPLSDNQEDNKVKSIAAIIVYPKDPIYDVKELNSFAEENLVPLFGSFNYEEAEIRNKTLLKIPIPYQKFMTVPCLKRIDESLAVSSTDLPDHEIHYHIILAPDKKNASNYLLPKCWICDKYTINLKDLKKAS